VRSFDEKGVDSPRLSAELLIGHVLGLERIQLYTLFDRVVDKPKLAELRAMVKRAGEHEPVAYLVGRCEFYSLPLTITPDCLIPRPETEGLVERCVHFLRNRERVQHVLDLCTGSGCIAAAIAKNVEDAQVVATDVSDAALKVAAENIEKLKLTEKVQLLCGDLFDPVIEGLDAARFDLIVSNPPYVSEPEYAALDKNVKDYEPAHALLAGADGLDVYKRILEKVDDFLKPDGALMMEIGYAQGPAIRELLEASGVFKTITIEKDFANNDRIAVAAK
jgi:release factor glutamine methyltransferase